jgi:hypothetical protein
LNGIWYIESNGEWWIPHGQNVRTSNRWNVLKVWQFTSPACQESCYLREVRCAVASKCKFTVVRRINRRSLESHTPNTISDQSLAGINCGIDCKFKLCLTTVVPGAVLFCATQRQREIKINENPLKFFFTLLWITILLSLKVLLKFDQGQQSE